MIAPTEEDHRDDCIEQDPPSGRELLISNMRKRLAAMTAVAERLALEVAAARVCKFQPNDAINFAAFVELATSRAAVDRDPNCRKLVGKFPEEPWRTIRLDSLQLGERATRELATKGYVTVADIVCATESVSETVPNIPPIIWREIARRIEATLYPTGDGADLGPVMDIAPPPEKKPPRNLPRVGGRRPIQPKIVDGVELWPCRECRTYQPKSDFHKSSGYVSGIKGICRYCSSTARNKRRKPCS